MDCAAPILAVLGGAPNRYRHLTKTRIASRWSDRVDYGNELRWCGFGELWDRPVTAFTVNSPTSITATSPAGYRTVDVTVSTTSGTSSTSPADHFTFLPAAHDFNDDGKSDIAWRDTAGDAGLWLMNGSQILQTGVIGNLPNVWAIVGQRDFNGDGNADFLWRGTTGDVSIWLMNGFKIFRAPALSAACRSLVRGRHGGFQRRWQR